MVKVAGAGNLVEEYYQMESITKNIGRARTIRLTSPKRFVPPKPNSARVAGAPGRWLVGRLCGFA